MFPTAAHTVGDATAEHLGMFTTSIPSAIREDRTPVCVTISMDTVSRRGAGRPVEAHRSIDNNRRPYGQQHHDAYRNNRPGTPVYNNRNQKDNNFQNRNDRGNYRRESSTRTTVNTRDTGSRGYNRNNQAAPSNNRNAYGRQNSGNSSFRNSNSRTFSSGNRSVSRGSNATTRSASPQSQGSPSSRISRR